MLENDEAENSEPSRLSEQAIEAFLAGTKLHPHEPIFAIFLGNTYSLLDNDPQAELWLEKATILQGKQEPAFRAHYSLASHYLRRAQREFLPDNPDQALASLAKAVAQIEIAFRKMHWPDNEMHELRLLIYENFGRTRESKSDLTGAMETFQFATTLPYGERIHYRTALILGKLAKESWNQRNPERALSLFLQARQKIDESRGVLPADISPEQRQEYIDYLDRRIAFLKAAKVDPK